MSDEISRQLIGCSRCGVTHDEPIIFKKLINPMGEHTHWGVCPTTKQPIMLKFGECDHVLGVYESGSGEETVIVTNTRNRQFMEMGNFHPYNYCPKCGQKINSNVLEGKPDVPIPEIPFDTGNLC